MRAFTGTSAIARLSLEARVVYGAFLVFLLAGGASSVWLYRDSGLGLQARDTTAYINGSTAGDVAVTRATAPATIEKFGIGAHGAEEGGSHHPSDAGPDLSALDTQQGYAAPTPPSSLRLAKPERQLWETFHFHLFSVPVVLLIISHIFMLCSLSARVKIGTIGAAHLSALVHLLAPLLVRHGFAGAAPMFVASALLMAGSWLFISVWPLWEMCRTPLPPRLF